MNKLDTLLTAYAASPTKANRDAIAALFSPAHVNLAELTAEIATLKACLLKREQSLIDAKKALDAATVQPAADVSALRKVIHELRTYSPAGDRCNGVHIHPSWADKIEAAIAPAADMSAPTDERAAFETWFDSVPEKEWMRTILAGHREVARKVWRAARAAAPSQPTDEALVVLLDGYARDGTRGYQHYVERIIAWADARAAAPVSQHCAVPVGSVLSTGQILAADRRSSMSDDEALRFGRAIESMTLSAAAAPVSGPSEVPGLGRVTNEDNGCLTLQFQTDDAAQAFMHNCLPSVDVRDMPPIPDAPEPAFLPTEAAPVSGQGASIGYEKKFHSLALAIHNADRVGKFAAIKELANYIDSRSRSEDSRAYEALAVSYRQLQIRCANIADLQPDGKVAPNNAVYMCGFRDAMAKAILALATSAAPVAPQEGGEG